MKQRNIGQRLEVCAAEPFGGVPAYVMPSTRSMIPRMMIDTMSRTVRMAPNIAIPIAKPIATRMFWIGIRTMNRITPTKPKP